MRRVKTSLNSQLFPDGLAVLHHVTNTAAAGDRPRYSLTEFVRVPYERKQLGDVRYYAAMQADSRISAVLRVPQVSGVQPSGDIVLLSGDDTQYKITRVSEVPLSIPPAMDLTLEVSKTTYTRT